ncbi:hypothetical protein ELI39_31120 (plasmid) [Rhizobium ruizarguesonis]|nr:hypothetical protein ELI39_31120 [Rhizobium ruizarguesonis]
MQKLFLILFGVVAMSGIAHAQARVTATHRNGLVESYRAYIGEADLFNSSCWFPRGTEPVFPPRSEPPLSMVF